MKGIPCTVADLTVMGEKGFTKDQIYTESIHLDEVEAGLVRAPTQPWHSESLIIAKC